MTTTENPCSRDLYLDLIIKVLANVIYGNDPSMHPDNRGIYRPELRADGRDWPSLAHSMAGLERLQNVRHLAQRVIDEDVPGDFIETGVWRGGCCILMRAVLEANAVTSRKVYVADSFNGVPPPRPAEFSQDEGLNFHHHRELAVPVDEVKDNFSRYGLLDDLVVFVEGLFHETLPRLEAEPFSLIRLDGDLYESTYVALESLYPKLSPGGFVIVDDYGAIAAAKAAVCDYRARIGIEAPIQTIDWTGIWWQKPGS